jgi:hypothetical protein
MELASLSIGGMVSQMSLSIAFRRDFISEKSGERPSFWQATTPRKKGLLFDLTDSRKRSGYMLFTYMSDVKPISDRKTAYK